MKLLTSFTWIEAFKAAAKDTGVIQGPERETPEQKRTHGGASLRRPTGGDQRDGGRWFLGEPANLPGPYPRESGADACANWNEAEPRPSLCSSGKIPPDSRCGADIRTGHLMQDWYDSSYQSWEATRRLNAAVAIHRDDDFVPVLGTVGRAGA